MDGATSQQIIQQKWTMEKEATTDEDVDVSAALGQQNLNDQTVIIVSFVPLQMSHNDEKIWVNDRPSSVRYCRIIKFEFTSETAENTLKEYNYYSQEMNNFRPT